MLNSPLPVMLNSPLSVMLNSFQHRLLIAHPELLINQLELEMSQIPPYTNTSVIKPFCCAAEVAEPHVAAIERYFE